MQEELINLSVQGRTFYESNKQELHRMGLYFFLEKFPFLWQDNEEETFKMGLKGVMEQNSGESDQRIREAVISLVY